MLPRAARLRLHHIFDSTVDYVLSPFASPTFQPLEYDLCDSDDELASDEEAIVDPISGIGRSTRASTSTCERAVRWCCCCFRPRPGPGPSSSYRYPRPRSRSRIPLRRMSEHREISRLEDKCRRLERALKESKDALRGTESELSRIRQDGPSISPNTNGHHHKRPSSGDHRRRSDAADSPFRIPSRREVLSMHTVLSSPSSSSSRSPPLPASPTAEDRARRHAADTFLSLTDGWSGAQVLQSVHDLNSEILQFAAAAVEAVCFSPSPSSSPSSHPSQSWRTAQENTTARLGAPLTRALASRSHALDPLLVQIALQGAACAAISRSLSPTSTFCPGLPSKSDAVLSQLYNHISLTEPQPTAARWRSLAHSHLHSLYGPTLAQHAADELTDTLLRWCTDVLLLSSSPSPNSSSPMRTQLARLAATSLSLSRVLREELLSTSFELLVFDVDDPAVQCEDAFGEYVPSRGAVLCTTELGLRCVTRTGTGVGVGAMEENGRERERKVQTLLRPKVVLESVVDIVDAR